MKTCSTCNQPKSVEEFNWRNKAKGVRHGVCKECTRNRDKKHYKTSASRRQAVRERTQTEYDKKIEWYNNYKATCSCAKCGETKPYMLDFHHKDRDLKKDVVFNLIRNGYVLETIKEEIDKCIPLCANHHREFHFLEGRDGITLEEYLEG